MSTTRHEVNAAKASPNPFKISIPEEDAPKWKSKISRSVRQYFPEANPKMVDHVVENCVQERVQIKELNETVQNLRNGSNDLGGC